MKWVVVAAALAVAAAIVRSRRADEVWHTADPEGP
jgi:hypothetical protein